MTSHLFQRGYQDFLAKIGMHKQAGPTPEQIAAMQSNVAAGKQRFQTAAAGSAQNLPSPVAPLPQALGGAAPAPAAQVPSRNPLLAQKPVAPPPPPPTV